MTMSQVEDAYGNLWRLRAVLDTTPFTQRLEVLRRARQEALSHGDDEFIWRIDLAIRAQRGERILPELEHKLGLLAHGAEGPDDVEGEFRRQLKKWQSDTAFTSSMSKLLLHPAYQRIIGMGWAAVPLLLRELAVAPSPLGWALQAITGEDPVPAADAGRLDRVAAAWLQWGREHGHLP